MTSTIPKKQGRWARFKAHRPWVYLISIIMMAFTGAASPLLSRFSYSFTSYPCDNPESCDPRAFNDFMALTWMKYITVTTMASIVWFWDYRRYLSWKLKPSRPLPYFSSVTDIEKNKTVPKSRWLLISLCSIFDVGFSICQRSAMLYTHAANVQIFSNLIVILSAFFKMLIPREALLQREWLAVFIITCGLICTSIDSLLNLPPDVEQKNGWLGIVLALSSAFCKAMQVNIEHKLFRKYRYPPMKFMIITGTFSTCLCLFMSYGYYKLDVLDFRQGWHMITNNGMLFLVAEAAAITACLQNLSSSIVQKFTSAVHREVFCMNAVVLTWVLELIFGLRAFEVITFVAELTTCCGIILHSGVWSTKMPPSFEKPVLCGGCLELKVQTGLVIDDVEEQACQEPKAASMTKELCSEEHSLCE